MAQYFNNHKENIPYRHRISPGVNGFLYNKSGTLDVCCVKSINYQEYATLGMQPIDS